jgi:hypothetical protein
MKPLSRSFINYRQVTTFLLKQGVKRGLSKGRHVSATQGHPLLTPHCRKESCDLTVINKAYIVALHNGMDIIKLCKEIAAFGN